MLHAYLFLIISSRRYNCRRRQCLQCVGIIHETNKLTRTCARRRIPFCPTSLIISTVARNLLPSQVHICYNVYKYMYSEYYTVYNSIYRYHGRCAFRYVSGKLMFKNSRGVAFCAESYRARINKQISLQCGSSVEIYMACLLQCIIIAISPPTADVFILYFCASV